MTAKHFILKPTLITYLAAVCLVVFAFLTHQVGFNSDALYLPSVFSDVFIVGHPFGAWHLTPAPYFFPDMLVFFLINTVVSNVFYAFMFFAILQVWATIYLASKITFFVTRQQVAVVITHLSILLALLFLTEVNEAFHKIIKASCHFGTIINGLIFIYFLLSYLESRKKGYLWVLFFTSLIGVGSDLLFEVQFVFPAIAALFLCKFFKKITYVPLVKSTFVLLLGSYIGFSAKYFLQIGNEGYHIFVHSNNIMYDFSRITNDIFFAHPLAGYIIALFYLLLVVASAFKILSKKPTSNTLPDKNLLLFLMVFIVLSFLFIFESSIINDAPSMRYFLNVYWLPILFSWILFLPFLNANYFSKCLGVVLYLLVILSVGYKTIFHVPYQVEYYPDFIACIDTHIADYNASHPREKIKYGISTYWQAKVTTIFSKEKVVISQYENNLNRRLWITSDENYRDQYDFAITSQEQPLNIDMLEELNGKPALQFQCNQDIGILIYGKNKLHVTKIENS